MKDGFTIAIIRASDGRMAIWHEDYDTAKWDRDTAQFCWQEGNFACDCNRHTFFEEADGREDDDIPCSHGLYIVPVLVWDDGQVMMVDQVDLDLIKRVVDTTNAIKSGVLQAQ
jgi:hypothetical protein